MGIFGLIGRKNKNLYQSYTGQATFEEADQM